jgi:hypothetical protein
VLLALAATPGMLPAQARVQRERGLDLVAVTSRTEQWLAGGSLWRRVSPRTRLGGLLAGGVAGGKAALRAELAGHFLLNPNTASGWSLYGGGGLAFSRGKARGEHILVVVGIESRAGATRGWVLEAGLAGGVRLGFGWRWRGP